jgi:hypothetical protein
MGFKSLMAVPAPFFLAPRCRNGARSRMFPREREHCRDSTSVYLCPSDQFRWRGQPPDIYRSRPCASALLSGNPGLS